jgi:hypothetical protein
LRFVPSAENLPFSQPFAQRLFTRDEPSRIAANIAKVLASIANCFQPVRS